MVKNIFRMIISKQNMIDQDFNEGTSVALEEVEKMKADSAKDKSYTDVGAMMQKLLV